MTTPDISVWMPLSEAYARVAEVLNNPFAAKIVLRDHLTASEIGSIASCMLLTNRSGDVFEAGYSIRVPSEFWGPGVYIDWNTDLALSNDWTTAAKFCRADGLMVRRADVHRLWPTPTGEWISLSETLRYVDAELEDDNLARAAIVEAAKQKSLIGRAGVFLAKAADGETVAGAADFSIPADFWFRAKISWEEGDRAEVLDAREIWLRFDVPDDQVPLPVHYLANYIEFRRLGVMRLWPAAPPAAVRPLTAVEDAILAHKGNTPLMTPRRVGRRPEKFERIVEEMARMDADELDDMHEKEMAGKFGAARSTCVKARRAVQLRRVEN